MTDTLSGAVPDQVEEAADRLLAAACDKDLSLVTAESCTGGLFASMLTDVSGRSHAFERGFVTYTNESKAEMLGVDAGLLDDPGPVSEPVARAMAEGALAAASAHVSVAVTGVAGPGGGTPLKPVGLVHFATARTNGRIEHRAERFGDIGRDEVREASLMVALEMLRERLGPT